MKLPFKASHLWLLLLAAIWIYGLYDISISEKQWDFKTYYFAAVAHERGMDPYDRLISESLSGKSVKLSYIYPPLSLWFFRLFTFFEFGIAQNLYLILKVILLAGLLLLWRFCLFDIKLDALFLWFVTLAFSSTIYWDVTTGNIGILEQFIFWGAIAALLRGKLTLFVLALVLVSCFKLTWIVFLVFPLLWKQRRAAMPVAAGFSAFLIYLLANYLMMPKETNAFIKIVTLVDERGESFNHSLLAMIRDLFDRAATAEFLPQVHDSVPLLFYAAAVLVIITISWLALQKTKTKDPSYHLQSILLSCLAYSLAMPRMKAYSFILLIPIAYIIIRQAAGGAFLYLFLLLSLTKWTPLPVPDAVRFLWWYYPWLAALLLWWLAIRNLSKL